MDLPATSRSHPVFHVSLLKKALKPHVQPQPLPPMLSEELELQVTPEAILQWREDQKGNLEVLVHWDKLPTCEDSWEFAAQLQESFPSFHLRTS